MGRFEAFAMANKPWPSIMDGFGNALGYGFILILVAIFRELLGSGSLYGFRIIPESFYEAGYMNNNMMILPPMALVVTGIIIWVQRTRNKSLIEEH
jgi:Na+-transporting NADH:ubiquinone oxidoreductase subunit D